MSLASEENPWERRDVPSPVDASPPVPLNLPGVDEAQDPWAAFDRPSSATSAPSAHAAPPDIAHQAVLHDFDPFSPKRNSFENSLRQAALQRGSPSVAEISTSSASVNPPSGGHSENDLASGGDEVEGARTPLLSTLGSLFKRPLATPPPPEQSKTARTGGLMQAIVGSGAVTPVASGSRTSTPGPTSPSRRFSADLTNRLPEKAKSPHNEEAPFDFNRFLEQMRDRRADPIARYLRSFLKEFGKRSWKVQEQIRVINDFLDFISTKMRNNEVWSAMAEHDFDNAIEGMEKLVMNRVYDRTFTPALVNESRLNNPTDDLERDHVLSQRMRLFGWLKEEHLDLPAATEERHRFMSFAQTELRKINQYKAPRDKLITILNCCKVIYGLMRHARAKDEGADLFVPYLILIVLRANPEHLVSNIQYIQRFRNPEKLQGEAGYYLSSLNGAISFIESLDQSALSNITQDDFEHHMEQAVADVEEHTRPSLSTPVDVPPEQDLAAALPEQGGFFDIRPLEAIRGVFSDFSLGSNNSSSSNNGGAKVPHIPPQLVAGVPVKDAALIPPVSPRRKRGYTNSVYSHESRSNESLASPLSPQLPQQPEMSEEEATARRKQQANLQTLASMFPGAEPSVLEIVLLSHGGNMEQAIDSLLEIST